VKRFRTGTFEREQMPRALRKFSPAASLERVEQVDLDALKAAGKRVLLLDVDNTLLPWREHEFPQPVLDWIEHGKSLGLEFCILSNTRHPKRLQRLSDELGVPFIRAKFKPSRQMYDMALERYAIKPEQAVMIGDQLLTDVLGANRAGIDAFWIKPVGKREFIGTRLFSRNVERVIGRFLFDYVEAPAGSPTGFFRSDLFKQIVKFCLVGGSSFVIDYCVKMTLRFAVPYGDDLMSVALGRWLVEASPSVFAFAADDPVKAAVVPISIVAAGAAIVNSFVWNRRWTFRIVGREERSRQFAKFLTVSLIGLALNTLLTTFFTVVLPGGERMAFRAAIVLAAAVTAFWNFTGQRLYAFRKK
jgi:HAD superfamily phosphatase (TIGR01668 family)